MDEMKNPNSMDDSAIMNLNRSRIGEPSDESNQSRTQNKEGSDSLSKVEEKIVDVPATCDFILMNPVLTVFALGELKFNE